MTKKLILIVFLTLSINFSYSQSSGTGFLISSDGYIVTCYHVIENSKEINIKGINGDYAKEYDAKVVATDINNDIAVLKVNVTLNHNLKYGIKWEACEVGEDIFTLGFPLKTTMGEEIKLTNGIISANSGFQGNISNYQISVPVQPGNSGGPLFDKKGNIVGIVNAKHVGTDNVSYAVKSIMLKNLIDSYPQNINYIKSNIIFDKPLTEQIKLIKQDVLLIEVENDNSHLNDDESPITIFTKTKAKIKNKPDAMAYIISYVEPDTKLEVIGKKGDYWEIFFKGDIAYVHDLYIKKSEITSYIKYSLPEKYKSFAVEATTKAISKLRYEPSPLSNIKKQIPKDETIYVIGYNNNYWKIFYRGEEGYLIDGLYFETSYKMMKFKKH